MKTHIVMPIGVSQPGTPIIEMLRSSIDSILNQTEKNLLLTVASDINISDECKKLLEDKKVNIKWFPESSFFKRGGIWKKITDTWKSEDSEYISFIHYDDFWDKDKLKYQIEAMENENLNSSWSEVYVMNDNYDVVSQDCSTIDYFSKNTIGIKTLAQAHAMIVNREKFFNSGIMDYEEKWSPVFEELYVLFCNKIGNGRKVQKSRFYWRNHENNMSNSILSKPVYSEIVNDMRGEYTNNEVKKDLDYMLNEMEKIKNEYRKH